VSENAATQVGQRSLAPDGVPADIPSGDPLRETPEPFILDVFQDQAVRFRGGELRLLGGGGTGKSSVLAYIAAQLVQESGPNQILGLASSRAAARTWQADVLSVGPTASAPHITTPHALALEIVQQVGLQTKESMLLTAPEQETRIRELLQGGSPVGWPSEWKLALTTRAFARQVRRAVARIRGLGLEPATVRAWAQAQNDQGWVAVANFTQEYLDVLAWEGVTDYQELLLASCRALETSQSPEQRWNAVLVDDAQELDALQWRLLKTLSQRTQTVVIAGDPYQSITGFRGAMPELLTHQSDPLVANTSQSGSGSGQYRTTLVLGCNHRGSAPFREASLGLMRPVGVPGLPDSERMRLLAPIRTEPAHEHAPKVSAQHYESEAAQAEFLAAKLVVAHKEGVRWRDMAVLLRSSRTEAPVILRALRAALIPVQSAITDLPLAAEPAVATLLRAATVAAAQADALTDDDAEFLLASPLIGLTPEACRSVQRWLDSEPTSGLAAAVRDPVGLAEAPKPMQFAVRRILWLGELLQSGRRLVARERPPAEILWHFWAAGQHRPGQDSWPERLRSAALGAGATAPVANRELDAVVALFRLAERAPERWGGHRGLAAFVEEIQTQDIAAEPDLQSVEPRETVLVTSIYRARGRQWPLVALPNVSDPLWMAPQTSGGLLRPDDLTDMGLVRSQIVKGPDDRRLLNFALSRASEELWLGSHGQEGPARTLELAGVAVSEVLGFPDSPPTKWQLLHELRAGSLSDEAQTQATAVTELVRLTQAESQAGQLAFPGANPSAWPGAREWTISEQPLRPTDAYIQLSPSALSSLSQCQLRWFFERQLKAGTGNNPAALFGTVIHAAISDLIQSAEAKEEVLAPNEALQRYWAACEHDSEWHAQLEQGRAELALERAASWIAARPGRLVSEYEFSAQIPIAGADATAGGAAGIILTGSIDALELAESGAGTVWDFKTKGQKTPQAELVEHVQLQAYQLALQVGDPDGPADAIQGAGLVHVCVPQGAKQPTDPAQGMQDGLNAGGDGQIRQEIAQAVDSVRAERFAAQPGKWCRTCEFAAMCPCKSQRPV
jgi:superfamily I DNA/RNA helicase/RecB family exonuclease